MFGRNAEKSFNAKNAKITKITWKRHVTHHR